MSLFTNNQMFYNSISSIVYDSSLNFIGLLLDFTILDVVHPRGNEYGSNHSKCAEPQSLIKQGDCGEGFEWVNGTCKKTGIESQSPNMNCSFQYSAKEEFLDIYDNRNISTSTVHSIIYGIELEGETGLMCYSCQWIKLSPDDVSINESRLTAHCNRKLYDPPFYFHVKSNKSQTIYFVCIDSEDGTIIDNNTLLGAICLSVSKDAVASFVVISMSLFLLIALLPKLHSVRGYIVLNQVCKAIMSIPWFSHFHLSSV